MVKRDMYQKIMFLKEMCYTKSEIVERTGLDWKTVRKYFSMEADGFSEYALSAGSRYKGFESYKQEILECYARNGNRPMQKSSIYDYLEERHGELPCTERTIRNYIEHLILTGQLLIEKSGNRRYHPVPELPFGRQLQLDFGEFTCGNGLKLYIFAAVLSASRYKFAALQEKPFTTDDTIQHILSCFHYFGGMPEELVIDQDSVMVVSENKGDIIYTKKFRHFIDEMGLKMFVCRRSDPESKGKVENLVKYVKRNFLATRDFGGVLESNERLRKWLVRRGNGKLSGATKRVPAMLFEQEQKHLRPLRQSIYEKCRSVMRDERKVDNLCRISVKAIKYPVPERYRNSAVDIYKSEERLFIFDQETGEQVAEFRVRLIPGEHVYDRRAAAQKLIKREKANEMLLEFHDLSEWREFVGKNQERYKRYYRDQYNEAHRKLRADVDEETLRDALCFCLKNGSYSMCDLHDAYRYMCDGENSVAAPDVVSCALKKPVASGIRAIAVATRAIGHYSTLAGFGGEVAR